MAWIGSLGVGNGKHKTTEALLEISGLWKVRQIFVYLVVLYELIDEVVLLVVGCRECGGYGGGC